MESGTLRGSSFSSHSLLSGARQHAMIWGRRTLTRVSGPDLSSAHSTIREMHRDGQNHHRITMSDTDECPAAGARQRAQRRKKPACWVCRRLCARGHSDLKLQLLRATEARALQDDTCSGLCSPTSPPPPAFHFLTEN